MKNVALITGSYGGLGSCFAEIHARNGNDLVLVGRDLSKLQNQAKYLTDKYKIQVEIIEVDLLNPNASKYIYDTCQERKIIVSYLINNAGFGGQGDFARQRLLEDDMKMIKVNVEVLTELCKLFLPDFINNKNGRILNVSSTASLLPGPLQAVYFATKSYVTSFSNALWRELKDTNITVTALLPGAMHTGFASTGGLDDTRLFKYAIPPMKVAEKGYKAMMKGKMNVIAGLNCFEKFAVKCIPIFPKKKALDIVYNLQKVTK